MWSSRRFLRYKVKGILRWESNTKNPSSKAWAKLACSLTTILRLYSVTVILIIMTLWSIIPDVRKSLEGISEIPERVTLCDKLSPHYYNLWLWLNYAKRRSVERPNEIIVKAAIVAVLAAVEVVKPHLFPQPYHTSMHTGQDWIDKLLNGHHKRMRRNLGMQWHVFLKLTRSLTVKCSLGPTRYLSTEESLGIFLHMLITNHTIEEEAEVFQRSPDTIYQ